MLIAKARAAYAAEPVDDPGELQSCAICHTTVSLAFGLEATHPVLCHPCGTEIALAFLSLETSAVAPAAIAGTEAKVQQAEPATADARTRTDWPLLEYRKRCHLPSDWYGWIGLDVIEEYAAHVRSQAEDREREAIAVWHEEWARRCARIAVEEHNADRHFNGTTCEAYERLHQEAAATIRARSSSHSTPALQNVAVPKEWVDSLKAMTDLAQYHVDQIELMADEEDADDEAKARATKAVADYDKAELLLAELNACGNCGRPLAVTGWETDRQHRCFSAISDTGLAKADCAKAKKEAEELGKIIDGMGATLDLPLLARKGRELAKKPRVVPEEPDPRAGPEKAGG